MALLLRTLRRNFSKLFLRLFFGIIFIYVYCEYLIYYVTQIQCGWSSLSKEPSDGVAPVYALVMADTHLLGSRHGDWLDKWRREWQMHRAFQTAMTLHRPDVVFVLGDLFDEGMWCSEKEFNDYVERYYKMFQVPEGTAMYSIVGNHDIGFHYRITPQLVKRFESHLKSPPVQLVSIRGNHFILINSMAMEGDGCSLCSRAVTEIDRISDILKCSSGSSLCKGKTKLKRYSRPILMQHYPLYRESDSMCTEPDAAPLPERNNMFEERWDCLSKESTEYLVESLYPRAAFGGHTHHSCVIRHSFVPTLDHKIEFVEYTVPSFSWRNRLDPKYYLLTITPEEVKVSKCEMPREWTMQITAILMTIALLVYLRYCGSSINTSSQSYKFFCDDKIIIIKRGKGQVALYDRHQCYHHKTYLNGSTYWFCTKRKKNNCVGSITAMGSSIYIKRISHIKPCICDFEKNKADVCLDQCMNDVASSLDPVPTIYKNIVSSITTQDAGTLEKVPEFTKIKSTLNKRRNDT